MYVMDIMLKKLTRWLRILGINAVYPPSEDDDIIIEYAMKKNGVLVTSDKEMSHKAENKGVRVIFIQSQCFDNQLIEFVEKAGVELPNEPIERYCPICNGKLIRLTDQQILTFREKIPPKVSKYNKIFWMCDSCTRIYWKGTHYDEIVSKIKEIKRTLKKEENKRV
ncbi:hypothetical protein J7J26_00985 [Candidatus Micrarchaeota archaeon]|nr:hypothetical protein [Candidatus Micrarchaeota archaeon]